MSINDTADTAYAAMLWPPYTPEAVADAAAAARDYARMYGESHSSAVDYAAEARADVEYLRRRLCRAEADARACERIAAATAAEDYAWHEAASLWREAAALWISQPDTLPAVSAASRAAAAARRAAQATQAREAIEGDTRAAQAARA